MKTIKLINSMLFKLILLMSVLTIIPLLILGIVSYNISGNILKQELKGSASKAQEKMISNIDLGLHDIAGIADSLSESSQLLSDFQSSGAVTQSSKTEKYDELLSNIQTSSTIPMQILVIDSSGKLYFYQSLMGTHYPSDLLNAMSEKIVHSVWYKKLFRYDSSLQWLGLMENYDSQNGGKTMLYIAQNITDGVSYIGTILIGLPDYFISKQLNNALISSESSVLLLDSSGSVILSSEDSNSSVISIFEGLHWGALKNKLNSGSIKIGNVNFIVNLNNFSYFGWQMVQLTPERSFFSKFYYISRVTLLLMLACSVLIVITMLLLQRNLIEPVATLSRAMCKVQKGDLSIRSKLVRSDEIGVLSDGFNNMVGEINNLIIKIKAEEQDKREMEFRMLQAQIKPHFLYNALNSIKWMADIKSQHNISKAITTLVKMLEYSLNERSVFVTLRQEKEYLSWYIHLSSIRYGNSFDCVYDVDEDLNGTYIIKLLLQPIVENAISHGICGINGKGLVTIACHRQDSDMRMTVSDNGRGMSSEELARIRQELLSPAIRKAGPGGMGIRNVYDRIKAEYGSQYTLIINSAPNAGTVVEITAPVMERLSNEEV